MLNIRNDICKNAQEFHPSKDFFHIIFQSVKQIPFKMITSTQGAGVKKRKNQRQLLWITLSFTKKVRIRREEQ